MPKNGLPLVRSGSRRAAGHVRPRVGTGGAVAFFRDLNAWWHGHAQFDAELARNNPAGGNAMDDRLLDN